MNRPVNKILFALISIRLLVGCVPEAPRSNPLDPELNTGSSKAVISGIVFTRYQPVRPLRNAIVQLQPDLKLRMTDATGAFRFEDLEPGNYRLIASKENYTPDTLSVSIMNNTTPQEINFFLNAVPQIRKMEFHSEHIDQWWPGEIYHAFLSIVVADSDGLADIDSVIYRLPAFDLQKPFESTTRGDSFVVDIDNIDLPQESLQHLIEQPSFVRVTDKSGGRNQGGPIRLQRIIEEAPIPVSPANLETASPLPLLEWQPISLPFSFTYLAQVYRITAGIPVLIHTSPELSPARSTYQFPDSLTSGTYFWTIGVRDNLKNFSRSKEASFMIP